MFRSVEKIRNIYYITIIMLAAKDLLSNPTAANFFKVPSPLPRFEVPSSEIRFMPTLAPSQI
jgi:hypothetical protein